MRKKASEALRAASQEPKPTTASAADRMSSKSPDETVEEKILERFTKDRLLDAEGLRFLKGKLATGDLRSEDWKLAFENAIERGKARKDD